MKIFTTIFLLGYFLLTLGSAQAQGFIINGADVVVTSGADIYVDGDANGGFTFTTAGGDVNLDGDIYVEGDWTNLGPTQGLTSRDVDGYVYLVGTTNQSVGGGAAATATYFENLTLNNAAGATATVDLNTIESVFDLEAGVFTLNQLTTVVDNTSTAAITRNTGSLRSEDNTAPYGTLRWNIATATGNYSLPFSEVGNTLIPLGFNVTAAGVGGTYFDFAMYYTIDQNTPLATINGTGLVILPNHATGTGFTTGGIDQWKYVLDRWYLINRDDAYATNPTTTLTFTYIDIEHTQGTNIINEANLQAQRYNEATTLWEGFSWINGVVNTAANTVTVAGMQGDLNNEAWVLVDNTEPLPIELLGFDANCDDDVITVSWASASETNNDFYTIEKSLDGMNWDFVATISGANGTGNSNQTLYYNYTDYSPLGQLSYYRLSQTDFDGSTVELGVEQATNYALECK